MKIGKQVYPAVFMWDSECAILRCQWHTMFLVLRCLRERFAPVSARLHPHSIKLSANEIRCG